MTIDISTETLRKLEHIIPEIRTRAINNVQSKFQSCRTDLQDLTVDVQSLIKYLLHWFELKPVTNVKQIFEILLKLLKSKYQSDTVHILSRYFKRGDLQRIEVFLDDPISKGYYNDIIQILNNHKVDFQKQVKIEINNDAPKNPVICEAWNSPDINANSPEGLQLEPAWEIAGQKELQELSQLKSSLCAKNNQMELEHALQYFQQRVYDFPSEFFLQSPFVFMSLLKLIECEITNFDHESVLTCCLKLTQSLSRRVTIRQLSSMHISLQEHVTKQQVTIGSYCYKTIEAVLNLLRNIYADSNLACVNECFLILIEIIALICKTAGTYSVEVANDYHIDEIIAKLADFLRFIREMTSNYRRNGHKTNRNNSISILFLLCQLLIFKENKKCFENDTTKKSTSPMRNETSIDMDISQKITCISLREARLSLDDLDHDISSSTTLDNNTLNSVSTLGNYVTATENIDDTIWKRELDIALLDFPLKHYYPHVNELIVYALKIDALPNTNPVKILMNLTEMLEPVVTLLKESKLLSNEKVLSHGVKSMDVLTLIKSDDLTKILFKAITSLTPLYNADEKLRKDAERLFLHMLSYGSIEMKRLVYKLASEKMSEFFGCILEGKKNVPRSYASTTHQSFLFGIPMSAEILAEIVCNGLSSNDPKCASYSENMLTLIIRTKDFLPKSWNDVCNFLVPVLPLILCYAKATTTFGKLILSLVEPESENQLPVVVLIKSSIVLLFARDAHTQGEGIYQLAYLLGNIPNAEIYMPNLNCITDAIPSNVCVVEPTVYSSNEDFSHLYEVQLIESLLNVLQNSQTEPSIRHSTLTQLNIIVEDPIALKHFYEIDGQSTILKTLEKSLRENSVDNYAYNAIQIVGILSKLCIRIPSFRRQLENDIQSYVLILRSLLLFHTDDKFKRECAILLFSLAFSGYIIGGNKQFILPPVCKRLFVPILCQFDWKSTLEQHNLLELILACEKMQNQFTETNSNHLYSSNDPSTDDSVVKIPQIWRYIRLTFNALWFGSLDQLIDSSNLVKGSKIIEFNYKKNPDSLSFNRQLCATPSDLEIVEGISQKYGLNYWLLQLKNATTWTQVTLSCAAIENFSNVDSVGHRKYWHCKQFLQSITRFCTIIPNTRQDEILFIKICRLLSNLIERDFIDVHIWILEQFAQKQCMYIELIDYSKVSTSVFLSNIRFIENVLMKTIEIQSKPIIRQLIQWSSRTEEKSLKKGNNTKTKPMTNLYDYIFEIAIKRLDTLLSEKKIDELKSLISLFRLLVSSGEILDMEYIATFMINKLMKLMRAMSLYSYVGSNFNRNCLLAVINIMAGVDNPRIDTQYIQYISTLCGHVDFLIRTFSWSILLKIAHTLTGATSVVQAMNVLPGGLYACCLNTLLDETESAIVRENAALVFAALISHRNIKNELNEVLYPKSAEGMDCEWIGHLLHHHDLIARIVASVKYLHVDEFIAPKQTMNNLKIVPCNLMRSYCIVLTHILPLKGAGDINPIFNAIHEISKVIPKISQSVNKQSILLLTEICELISQSFTQKKSLVELIVREFHVIQSLISFLNVDLLESIPKSIKHSCWPAILKVLRQVARSSVGFPTICEIFNQNIEFLEGAVTLFIYGLSDRDINIPIMRFITDLLIISQTTNYSFMTFADQLNNLKLSSCAKSSMKKFIFNSSIISQSIVDWLDGSDSGPDDDGIYASEILFRQFANFFERFNNSTFINELPVVNREKSFEFNCKSLETLLKCSEIARTIATHERFMLIIVDQMENNYKSVGGSFTDYIRRNGNTKAERFIDKLKQLLHIILCWYSADCLQDVECIQALLITCQKFWPSSGVNADLQGVFLKMLLFISDNSMPVCKALSVTPQFPISSSPFLQFIIEYCVTETKKPKSEQTPMETLQMALQIVTNCCCCIEGRGLITKTRMLHTLARLHPQVTRNHKPWPQLTHFWLELFETYTRHPDANKEAHLNLLCNLTETPSKKNRQKSLEILRNMAFNSENRAALLSSSDYQRVMFTVLDKKEIGDEQLLIVVTIWKLVANNAKGKNIIKNSPITTKLRALKEIVDRHMTDNRIRLTSKLNDDNETSSCDETLQDLEVALKHVFNILKI